MKKEQIYVVIDSEEKRLRALQILKDADEDIYKHSFLLRAVDAKYNILDYLLGRNEWAMNRLSLTGKTKITLDQLEEILNHKESIDQLTENFKSKAKELGFKVEIVFERIDPRIGMFGKFWDDGDDDYILHFGILEEIRNEDDCKFLRKHGDFYANFQPLTQSEIAELTKNNPK